MELQTLQGSARMRRTAKLSLEDYYDFTKSDKQVDLTVTQLNQIIEMHGFKRIYRQPKKNLIDAVNSIDLMDTCRSTLKDDNISACALITLEEVIKDLASLNWQECCVSSMQTLSSAKQELVLQDAESSKPKRKSRRPRKVRRLKSSNDIVGAPDAAHGSEPRGGLQSACSSAIVEYDTTKLISWINDGGFASTPGDFNSSSSSIVELAPN